MFDVVSAMLCSIRPWVCLGCRQIARRCLSSVRGQLREQDGTEKEFRPKKALLVRKVTRYEYEKFYLKPELSETQLEEYVRIFVVFTVRRYALHGLWDPNSVCPSVCLSVSLSVCPSHSWTVSTWFDL